MKTNKENFPKYFTPLRWWTRETIRIDSPESFGVYIYKDKSRFTSSVCDLTFMKKYEQDGETREIPLEEVCLLL